MTWLLDWLARRWPLDVADNDELDRALGFLEWRVDPGPLLAASNTLASVSFALGLSFALVLPPSVAPLSAVVLWSLSAAVWFGARHVPQLVALHARTSALGDAPALVTRAVVRMRLSPAPERAALFAADSGDGPLAASLRSHVRRADGTHRSGLAAFGREWRQWFPALDRALALVQSAGSEPPDQRAATLDRARTVVLDGTREQMSTFAASIRGPTTGLYAFGVLLPLTLVALLPAVRAAGLPVSLVGIAVIYDLLLPAVLLCASGWVLARRPVAFPPPDVSRSHPDVVIPGWAAPLAGAVAAVGGWLVAGHVLPPWTRSLAAVGLGAGTALVVYFHPIQRVRERIREIEHGLPDALALLGRRIERGRAVETAIDAVADELSGPVGDLFGDAVDRQRRLGLGVEASFLGEWGVLRSVPSRRLREAAMLLSLAARQGSPAGPSVTAMADHLDDLVEVEQTVRRQTERVTSTLANTAAVFGPLVGGATVALAGGMRADGPLAVGWSSTAGLGLTVGWYVLVLSAVLTALSVGLRSGLDRALVGYRVGWALLAATVTYLAAVVGAGLVVNV